MAYKVRTFCYIGISAILTTLSIAEEPNVPRPWKETPILRALRLSADTSIEEYGAWSARWKTEGRKRTDEALTINLLTEATFLPLEEALREYPNPALLEKCLIFLGTKVPREYDYIWRAIMLEMNDVDDRVAAKVNKSLLENGYLDLETRAMGGKKRTD